MTKLIPCPHCGFANAASAAFCGNCGRSMTVATPAVRPLVYCPHCEQENLIEATFCASCDRSLTAGEPTIAPPDLIPENLTVFFYLSGSPDAPVAPGNYSGRLNAIGVDINRNWLDSMGIPGVSVLLPNYSSSIDWENNLNGILAVLNEFAE